MVYVVLGIWTLVFMLMWWALHPLAIFLALTISLQSHLLFGNLRMISSSLAKCGPDFVSVLMNGCPSFSQSDNGLSRQGGMSPCNLLMDFLMRTLSKSFHCQLSIWQSLSKIPSMAKKNDAINKILLLHLESAAFSFYIITMKTQTPQCCRSSVPNVLNYVCLMN